LSQCLHLIGPKENFPIFRSDYSVLTSFLLNKLMALAKFIGLLGYPVLQILDAQSLGYLHRETVNSPELHVCRKNSRTVER
jgi:hypothetical protein